MGGGCCGMLQIGIRVQDLSARNRSEVSDIVISTYSFRFCKRYDIVSLYFYIYKQRCLCLQF